MGSIGVLVKVETTNRFNPNGGVIKPAPKAVTIMIQKCISFMPISWAKGSKSGDKITILGVVSMTHPAITRISIINKINIVGSLVNVVI